MNELDKLRDLTIALTSNGYLTDQTKAWKYAFDSVKELVCIVNPDYRIKFINKSFIYKLDDGTDLINERLSAVFDGNLFSEDEEEQDTDRIAVHYGESYIECLNGWYERSRYCIEDTTGDLIGYTFMLTDITERKLVEFELQESRDRIESIITAADGYLWEKDRSNASKEFLHRYIDSDFCRDFYGVDSVSCASDKIKTTGIELLNAFRKDGRIHTFGDMCVSTDDHVIEQGKPCDYYEMGYIEHDLGVPKWFILRVRKTPVFNDAGECVSIIGFANDCSNSSYQIKSVIERGLITGRVKKLPTNTEKARVYWITNNDEEDGKSLTHIDFP